jgi:hypothetical protein
MKTSKLIYMSVEGMASTYVPFLTQRIDFITPGRALFDSIRVYFLIDFFFPRWILLLYLRRRARVTTHDLDLESQNPQKFQLLRALETPATLE